MSETVDVAKIEKLKVTGGSGRKPIRFRFEYEGRKFDYDFEVFEGHLQGNGFMGTRTQPAKLVQIRNGSHSYGSVEIYKLKSAYCEQSRKDIAIWLIECANGH